MGVIERHNISVTGPPSGRPMLFAHGFGCDQHMWRYVGVLAGSVLHDTEIVLGPGDGLLLYTDGVTEGRRVKGFYGEQRLKASLARNVGSAGAMVDGVLDDVMRFQEGDPRDDIAMVAIRVPT